MSIRDRQLLDAEETTVMEELRAGRYPELSTVQQKITALFDNHPAGLPRFELYSMENGTVSNPDKFNTMIQTMDQDITTGFEEVSSLQNQMMALGNYYETERGKINKEMKKLAFRMKSLLEKSTVPSQANVFTQHFHDFLQIEFEGNDARNIPATDLFIDLKNEWATLDKSKTMTSRYDISGATIDVQITGNPDSTETQAPVENLLSDSVNMAWRYTVTTSEQGPVTLTLPIAFETPLLVTTVSFIVESPAPTDITLLTSVDGQTFIPKNTQTGKAGETMTWSIPATALTSIQFVLTKNEPDATQGTERVFTFGGSRILVLRDSFKTTGKVVSLPFTVVDTIVDKVIINTVETKLPGTNIRHYIGIDDPDQDHVEWIEADENGVVDYSAYATYLAYLDGSTDHYGDLVTQKYGNSFYALTIPTLLGINPVPGTSELYMGNDMWQMDILPAPPATAPVGATGPQDWHALAGAYTTKYVGVEQMTDGKQVTLPAGQLTRFTLYFYSDADRMPFRQTFSVDGSTNLSVYLNGTLLNGIKATGGVDYVYKIQKGLNQMVIYTYSQTAGYIAANIGFPQISSWARATNTPLNEVSAATLLNNTSIRDTSRFAYQDGTLMVNYDPKNLDVLNQGVRYQLTCQYPVVAPKTVGIRFMAIITKSQAADDTSASLSQYQLVVK